jgi:hypothetical protein
LSSPSDEDCRAVQMATPESGYDVIIAYSDTQDFLMGMPVFFSKRVIEHLNRRIRSRPDAPSAIRETQVPQWLLDEINTVIPSDRSVCAFLGARNVGKTFIMNLFLPTLQAPNGLHTRTPGMCLASSQEEERSHVLMVDFPGSGEIITQADMDDEMVTLKDEAMRAVADGVKPPSVNKRAAFEAIVMKRRGCEVFMARVAADMAQFIVLVVDALSAANEQHILMYQEYVRRSTNKHLIVIHNLVNEPGTKELWQKFQTSLESSFKAQIQQVEFADASGRLHQVPFFTTHNCSTRHFVLGNHQVPAVRAWNEQVIQAIWTFFSEPCPPVESGSVSASLFATVGTDHACAGAHS